MSVKKIFVMVFVNRKSLHDTHSLTIVVAAVVVVEVKSFKVHRVVVGVVVSPVVLCVLVILIIAGLVF